MLDLVNNVSEAASILRALEAEALTAQLPDAQPLRRRVVIGLSSLLTWQQPAFGDDATGSGCCTCEVEQATAARITSEEARPLRLLEDQLIALARPESGLATHVVAYGLTYGHGGGSVIALLDAAWRATAGSAATGGGAKEPSPLAVPFLSDPAGANCVPAIHLGDLATFVTKLAASTIASDHDRGSGGGGVVPIGQYLIAKDNSGNNCTWKDVATAISSAVGGGDIAPISYMTDAMTAYPGCAIDTRDLMARSDASLRSSLLPLSQLSLRFDPSRLAINTHPTIALAPEEWHCKDGLTGAPAAQLLRDEFAAHTARVPLRVCVVGPPLSGKTALATKLAQTHNLRLVTVKSAVEAVTGGWATLRELSDGTPRRGACLQALKDAVTKYLAEAEAVQASSSAAPTGGKAAGKPATAATTTGKKDAAKPVAAAADATTPSTAASSGCTANAPAAPRLPQVLLSRVLRAVLTSPAYRNAGWVLDGAPRTAAEAAALFEVPSASGGADGPSAEDPDGIMPPTSFLTALTLSPASYAAAFPSQAPMGAAAEGAAATSTTTTGKGTAKKPAADGGAAAPA